MINVSDNRINENKSFSIVNKKRKKREKIRKMLLNVWIFIWVVHQMKCSVIE